MTVELTALTLAALLQYVQFVMYAVPANVELGTGYTMSARDRDPNRAMTDKTARLGRAFSNHFEGLILFAIAIIVTELSNQHSMLTAVCATVYVFARIAYIPAYALGWRPWRSIIWVVGFIATFLILAAALF